MASAKRIGFFWGEEKITVVEFERNMPLQVVSASLGTKASSPFSSNLTEEIQLNVILKKLMVDNHIDGAAFYVSLPLKEIILRSFVIPFVKPEALLNAIKFEAKKYIPFDIQDLSFVYHTIPFEEAQAKRLQVIFYAARKEVLARYDRIFKQVDAAASFAEPYIVSLAKALLYRKEISPTDHIAFLILDKNLGRICFIDRGIPQFIREFPLAWPQGDQEGQESAEAMNLKIVNEVFNSFDFYARQFSGEKIDRILISSDFVQKDLMGTLETELKLKIIKFSPTINTGSFGSSSDMDAIYAMGACVAPPMPALANFNFLAEASPKSEVMDVLKTFSGTVAVLIVCGIFLAGAFVFSQVQLKVVQHQLDQLSISQGANAGVPQESIESETQQNITMLNQLKKIRTKSDMATVIVKVASYFQAGTVLTSYKVSYAQSDSADSGLVVDIQGVVFNGEFDSQIAAVNQVFAQIKNDKELSKYIKEANLVSLNRTTYGDKQATSFTIHFS